MVGDPRAAPASPSNSGITSEVPEGLIIHVESPSRVVESISTEWTNENHSAYLNLIETSFIHQLYSSEKGLKDLLGRKLRTQKHPKSSGLTANNPISSQFKVLRRGCWVKPNLKRTRSSVDINNETRIRSANTWIQHFRTPITGREIHLTSDQTDINELASQGVQLKVQRHGRVLTRQLQAFCSRIYHQDSVGRSGEASDHNSVDMELEGGERLNRSSRKRRVRSEGGELQIVPSGGVGLLSSSGSPGCAPSRTMAGTPTRASHPAQPYTPSDGCGTDRGKMEDGQLERSPLPSGEPVLEPIFERPGAENRTGFQHPKGV